MTEIHSITRAAERYGLALTVRDLDQMMLDITSTKLCEPSTALLAGIQADGKERWFVQSHGVAMLVLYCADRAMVVTILPPSGHPKGFRLPARKQNERGRGRRERPEDWRAEAS